MKKIRPSILGVGHCCQDCICTVEAYPPEDGSTHVLSMDDSQGGGAVATALAAAAKLGADARMLALVGDDPAGNRIVEGLASFGVGTELISRVPGGRSSTSWVMVNPATGSRTKFPYRDALPPLEFDHRAREAIAKADAVHLDGTRYENALKAALLAREAGVPVSLDGCSRQQDNSLNLKLSSLADILIMNAVYPFRVAGLGDREDALRFFGEQSSGRRAICPSCSTAAAAFRTRWSARPFLWASARSTSIPSARLPLPRRPGPSLKPERTARAEALLPARFWRRVWKQPRQNASKR